MNRKKKPSEEGARIAKVMARAGLCSRRDAETWIAAGRVAVNGAVIRSPALNVGEKDRITVDGKALPRRERTRLFLYHKPSGLVTTHADPEGRPTIFEALPPGLPRLISIGRLDITSEGLLLLTNDGELARALELPETGWLRRYRARAHGHVSQARLDTLRSGISIDGVNYGSVEATLDREQGANSWLTVGIREGKNREVRNVLGALGLTVNRLIRVSFGPFELADLPEGEVVEVPTRELRQKLGERVANLADLDFSGPISDAPPAREREIRLPRRERASTAPKGKPRERTDAPSEAREERLKRVQRHFSDTHAWRGGEAPLHRKFRGERAKDWKAGEGEGPKRAGEIADRRGRQVTVERYGEPKIEREREERGPRDFRRGRSERSERFSGGKFSGERPSRGRFGSEEPGRRGKFRTDEKLHGKFERNRPEHGQRFRSDEARGKFERDRSERGRNFREEDRRDKSSRDRNRSGGNARSRRAFDRGKGGPRPSRPKPKE